VQRHYGVRTQTHKLIHYYLVDEWELFDLVKDPGERRSVYADPAYSGVVKELKAELTRLRKLYRADTFKEPPVGKKGKRGDPKKVKPELVLRYTFEAAEKGRVKDISGSGHAGTLVKARLVKADDGPALELEGEGVVNVTRSAKFNPADSPLVIGAWAHPGAPRGVVASMGGEAHGFSLYLADGVPTFALRIDGKLILARAEKRIPNGRWAHVMGVLDADGRARVWVDGRASGEAVNAGHLARNPADGMYVGADMGSLVGDYRGNQHFTGRLRDVRLYRGVPAEAELKKWAKAE
jgi:hypothetical protein